MIIVVEKIYITIIFNLLLIVGSLISFQSKILDLNYPQLLLFGIIIIFAIFLNYTSKNIINFTQ